MPSYGLFLLIYLFILCLVVILAWHSSSQLIEIDGEIAIDSVGHVSTKMLYLNVVVSQGIILALLVGLLWWTAIPQSALGIVTETGSWGFQALLGLVCGVILYLANQASVAVLERFNISYSHALRRGLAPASVTGWITLFVVVLPVIALSEEILFRAAAIGVLSAGFAVSPWLLVVASSVLFAIGHGAQGMGGVLVTGILGAVLGAIFVLTSSLVVVVVAHYVINALEISVNEGILRSRRAPTSPVTKTSQTD